MRILIFLLALVAASAAQAQSQYAWFSAGKTCEGGSKMTYQVGVPFTISVCAQNTIPACGFTAHVEADSPDEDGLFLIVHRELHAAFSDSTAMRQPSRTDPLPIISDSSMSSYAADLGGTGIAGDSSVFHDLPLMTLTLIATPAAASARRRLHLSTYSTIGFPIPNAQYPTQPCADGYDVLLDAVPIYLDAQTLSTPWTRTTYGAARFMTGARELQ